ncbi:MAG: hypothetical protein V3R16_02625 [Nitrospirales bacterium]
MTLPSAELTGLAIFQTSDPKMREALVRAYARAVLKAAADHLHKVEYDRAEQELRAWIRKLKEETE